MRHNRVTPSTTGVARGPRATDAKGSTPGTIRSRGRFGELRFESASSHTVSKIGPFGLCVVGFGRLAKSRIGIFWT